MVTGRASAQQPEDPEDDKKLGLWLDQGISSDLTSSTSLEISFYERYDEVISNFYEYFVQGRIAFRARPWLTVTPLYRYQRFPGNLTTAYENRLLLNVTMATSRGAWRPNLRIMVEGRFPDNRPASARFRLRPGVDYTLPLRMKRRPVLVVNNEFFVVPGTNSFAAGGSFTQNRFQVGGAAAHHRFVFHTSLLFTAVGEPANWLGNQRNNRHVNGH